MLNVALIGFGLSGRYLQVPFFSTNTNFRLKTVLTNSQNPREFYPEVEVVKNLEEVLADKTIDLVSICSPNFTHFDYAKRCLMANKHVMVEKPFTTTISEAEELIELSKKHKKVLTVFQNRRFDSDFLTVKKILEKGILGDLLSYEAHFDRFKPLPNPKKWKETPAPGSGLLYDLGSHLIDQSLELFGKPKEVYGQSFIQREHSDVVDAFDIRLDYGKLKVTLKSSLLVREDSPRFILHGTKGSFIKYGLDVQEDQLKAGLLPNSPDFGKEPNVNWGLLNAEINELHIKGKIETELGNWGVLFQNLYEAIIENKELLIKPEQILTQISIIEKCQ